MQPINNTSYSSNYNSQYNSYNPPSKEAPYDTRDSQRTEPTEEETLNNASYPSKEAPYDTRDSQRTEPTKEEILNDASYSFLEETWYDTRDSQRTEPTEEEIKLWEFVGGNREGVSFGRRVALATSHFCHIPESILNLVTNVVKLVFTAIACAFSFGQVNLFNNEFRLALGRTMINFAGIGIHTVGVVAPVTALKWQKDILEGTIEKLTSDTDNQNDPNVGVPFMMSI